MGVRNVGFTKRRLEEALDRGWFSLGDKYVCDECFNDYALEAFVREHACSTECDYCRRTSKRSPIAADIDEVVEFIDKGILADWSHPDNEGVAYDSQEGGYQATVLDAWDLFTDELGGYFNNDKLLRNIIDAYVAGGAIFCRRNVYGVSRLDALRYGWKEFCQVVKHESRFVFLIDDEHWGDYRSHDEIPPSEFLFRLGELITEAKLVKELEPSSRFYRIRVHAPNERPRKVAKDLGPPPRSRAIYPNRMSPAGIPMFYGALERQTALMETYDPGKDEDKAITTGSFFTARRFPVCDFTSLPPIPSLFDIGKRDIRHSLKFLHSFVADLSAPVRKDGSEQIEYVPTQVVTEYLRRVYTHPEHGPVRGILYRSAQRSGGTCCVLFFDSEDCTEISPGWDTEKKFGRPKSWLGLDPKSVRTSRPSR